MTIWNDEDYTRRLAHANWMGHTSVLMHLNERATGDPARDWLSSWAHRWFAGDALRVLVLGCGEGWLERAVAQWPFVAHIDAVDFAADAVGRAREAARGIDKIDYGVVDLNRDTLPSDAYDVIVAHSVLHHVENLEHAYAELDRAMRRDATLIVNEYAGPKRFQFSDDVLGIINALLACIRSGETRTRPGVEEMVAHDPTEAVRSDELLALTAQWFDVRERKNLGGTILQHLLFGLVEDYRFDVPRERGVIELLCAVDGMLVDVGRVPSDFVILAATKKGSRARPVARPLPPRPEAAKDVDPDPLRRAAPFAARVGSPRVGGRTRATWRHALRMLRIALASQQPRRANLYDERAVYSWRERLLARGADPLAWILRRMPDDPPFRRLVETAATLAAE